MSLYSLIHDREYIRDGFRARVRRPEVKLERPLLAPPLTTNYRIVGAAFDYLLRFLLQRLNPCARTRSWVAEHGVWGISALQHGEYDLDENRLIIHEHPKQKKAESYLRDARREYDAYLKSGRVTDKLLSATLRLAHLDVAVRAGPEKVDWRALQSLSPDDISDLRALVRLVDERTFTTAHTCILNPTFSVASSLVGGADADLILDDCLVDIKTTKEPRLDIRDFYQLIGYWLLIGLGGIDGAEHKFKQHDISSLGIYFSRFGYLWKVPVEQVLPPCVVPDLTRWFVRTAGSSNPRRLELARAFHGPLARHLAIPTKAKRKQEVEVLARTGKR